MVMVVAMVMFVMVTVVMVMFVAVMVMVQRISCSQYHRNVYAMTHNKCKSVWRVYVCVFGVCMCVHVWCVWCVMCVCVVCSVVCAYFVWCVVCVCVDGVCYVLKRLQQPPSELSQRPNLVKE